MGVIYEWKLDKDAEDIIWLKTGRGILTVMLDTGGMWKLAEDKMQEIFTGHDRDGNPNGRCAAELFNSQHDITRTKLGVMMIADWQRLGPPLLEAPTPVSRAAELPYAPLDVIERYQGTPLAQLLSEGPEEDVATDEDVSLDMDDEI